MNRQTPDADGAESTVLEDTGTGCAVLLLGWIPPLGAALVTGVIVAVRTGGPAALGAMLIGGTVAGYVASVITLFTVGHVLEQRRVRARIANAFLILVLVIGVATAIAVAASVGSGRWAV
jgi:hypothetical protein